MKRRTFIALLGLLPAFAPLMSRAQPAVRKWRIGILESAPAQLNAANLAGFRKGLLELGYVEERDYVLDYRFLAEGSAEQHQETALGLVRAGVDVIVTRGSPAVAAAQNATATVPIVMAANAEPLGLGFVDSLARPRGNVTGLSAFTIELVPKQIELLRDVVPSLRRIAVVNNMSSSVGAARWEVIQTTTRAVDIEPWLYDVRNAAALEAAFAAAAEKRADALILGLDNVLRSNLRTLVGLAARYRLPAVYGAREFVEAGGLMSYGAKFPQLYFRAASFVDKIFKGAKPADIPVEQPTAVELVLNLDTARALGLAIPPTVLALADEVIE